MRFRALGLALLTLAALTLSTCGAAGGSRHARLQVRPTGPYATAHGGGLHVKLIVKPGGSVSSYDATLSWNIPPFPAQTGYNVFQDGAQVGSPLSSPYVFQGLTCGTTYTFGVQAHNGSGGTGPTYSTSYTAPGCPTTPLVVGINPGGGSCCGTFVDTGMATNHIQSARVPATGEAGPPSDFYNSGLKVDLNIVGNCTGSTPGAYDTSSVSDLSATGWATCALAVWQNQCAASVTDCPQLEVLNEPAGSWFWGGSANTQAAADNYAHILQDTWNDFHGLYGTNCDTTGACPQIVASFDGGCASGACNWGQKVLGNTVGITVENYLNEWTDHPYSSDSIQGGCQGEGSGLSAAATASWDTDFANITTTHSLTTKPLYITEVGWQTQTSACTGQQQADNVYGFLTWAQGSGYVAGVWYFNYSDFSGVAFGLVGNAQGANERYPSGNKPAWTAISQFAQGISCSVC